MKFRFQSFVDVSTSAASMQVLQWSVGGSEVVNRCRHLFGAYKYFKLGRIDVKMVPASTLPVDPQGLSYDEDDPLTVDPRDQMNPGLVRITNGEDIFTNVSALSEAQQINAYNTMMLDPRWSKFMLQSGFRRSAYPLYWQVGELSQDKYPGATVNVPYFNNAGTYPNLDGNTVIERNVMAGDTGGPQTSTERGSSARGLFQVGHRGKLGFLPTDFFQEISNATGTKSNVYGINNVPEVKVITCILPKAYKTIYYYRIFITEEVIFSGLRSSPPVVPYDGLVNGAQYMGFDQFIMGDIVAPGPASPMGAEIRDSLMNNGEKLP